MNKNLSIKTKSAIAKYGIDNCVWAYKQHNEQGDGASTIGFALKLTTQQADAAINAGRELDTGINWDYERREEARLDAMFEARYEGEDHDAA